jgi:DNA repair protein RadC
MTRIDEIIRRLLPELQVPAHLKPSDMLDESVVPPKGVADRVVAMRDLAKSGGSYRELCGQMVSSSDVAAYYRPRLGPELAEIVIVVGLNAKHHIVESWCVSKGDVSASTVGPRQVFRPLLLNMCSAFVLVHNHPSGEPTPSNEDVAITRRLRQVGEIVGIELIDHVIVGSLGHFSFADAGLLAA